MLFIEETNRKIRKEMGLVLDNFPLWCCLEAAIVVRNVFYVFYPNVQICKGFFRKKFHFWNFVADEIIDLTIDQFGDYSWGIVSEEFYDLHYRRVFVCERFDEEIYTDLGALQTISETVIEQVRREEMISLKH